MASFGTDSQETAREEDLAELVTVWIKLPPDVREAMLTLAQAASGS